MEKITDNYGKPRSLYIDKLAGMTEEQLRSECNNKIWLSAYANNNPRSDYHWQCDACYAECHKRGKTNIYAEEHRKISEVA